MATITFEAPDHAGRKDLKATRQRISDGSLWNHAKLRYEPAGKDAAPYGIALAETAPGVYAAEVPAATLDGGDVLDRLYVRPGKLTAADIERGMHVAEVVSYGPATDALRAENKALRLKVVELQAEVRKLDDRAARAELTLAEREEEAREVREFGLLLGKITSRAAATGGR